MKNRLFDSAATSKGSGRKAHWLANEHPKYYRFLKGAIQGTSIPGYSETGWQNIAKRFGLTVEEARTYANDFLGKGAGNDL